MFDPLRQDLEMSLDEYLDFELASDQRHEYVGGCVYAMTGGSRAHARIAGNVHGHVWTAARGGACQVYMSDFKLRTPNDRFYYPDVMTVCTSTDRSALWTTEPCLLVEVTSPSTIRTDRQEKRDAYLALPSLRIYLIVDQRRRYVEWQQRTVDGTWASGVMIERGAIDVPCPAMRLTLDDIYEGISFPPTDVRRVREPEPALD